MSSGGIGWTENEYDSNRKVSFDLKMELASRQMSEDLGHKPDRNAAGLMALLLVLPLVYVLSIGPMSYLFEKFHAPVTWRPFVVVFYEPVIRLHDSTSLKEPMCIHPSHASLLLETKAEIQPCHRQTVHD